jgi:hypothetical protein
LSSFVLTLLKRIFVPVPFETPDRDRQTGSA